MAVIGSKIRTTLTTIRGGLEKLQDYDDFYQVLMDHQEVIDIYGDNLKVKFFEDLTKERFEMIMSEARNLILPQS